MVMKLTTACLGRYVTPWKPAYLPRRFRGGRISGSGLGLLGLLAEEFLGLRVVDQNLGQVLLVQDEKVGKSMGLHIGCASVATAPCKQADRA